MPNYSCDGGHPTDDAASITILQLLRKLGHNQFIIIRFAYYFIITNGFEVQTGRQKVSQGRTLISIKCVFILFFGDRLQARS